MQRIFFKDPNHLDHFRFKFLPDLIARGAARHQLRFWLLGSGSSACFEGYSLAMTVLDVLPDARSLDVRIVVTLPDPFLLARAQRKNFSMTSLCNVPKSYRQRWFDSVPNSCGAVLQLDDAVCNLVHFEHQAPGSHYPLRGYFQAIFARDAGAFFARLGPTHHWQKLMPHLAPGGALYTAPGELLTGKALQQLRIAGTGAYVREAA